MGKPFLRERVAAAYGLRIRVHAVHRLHTAARNRNLTRTVLYSAAHPAAFAAAHCYSLKFPHARSALRCHFDRLDSRPTRSSAMVLISAHHHLLTSTSVAITPPVKSSSRWLIISSTRPPICKDSDRAVVHRAFQPPVRHMLESHKSP